MPSNKELQAALNLAFSGYVTKLFNVLMIEGIHIGAQREAAFGKFMGALRSGIEMYDRIEKEVKHEIGES